MVIRKAAVNSNNASGSAITFSIRRDIGKQLVPTLLKPRASGLRVRQPRALSSTCSPGRFEIFIRHQARMTPTPYDQWSRNVISGAAKTVEAERQGEFPLAAPSQQMRT